MAINIDYRNKTQITKKTKKNSIMLQLSEILEKLFYTRLEGNYRQISSNQWQRGFRENRSTSLVILESTEHSTDHNISPQTKKSVVLGLFINLKKPSTEQNRT